MAIDKIAAGIFDKKTPMKWIEMGEFHHPFGDYIIYPANVFLRDCECRASGSGSEVAGPAAGQLGGSWR